MQLHLTRTNPDHKDNLGEGGQKLGQDMRLRRRPVQALRCGLFRPSFPGLSMPVLKTIVEDATKQEFKDLATQRGQSESELLRALAVAATTSGQGAEQLVQPDESRADLDRITVRMPRFLMEGTKGRSRAKGMAPSRWISALVQSNLTAQPVMTDAEVEALLASNRELAAVGRNLSQVARALNASSQEIDKVQLATLTELSTAVTVNRSEIRRLVRASRQAWGIAHEPD